MPNQRIEGMWNNPRPVGPRTYVCGYCGDKVGPNQGYDMNVQGRFILLCSSCNRPTFFDGTQQFPAPAFGAAVEHVPSSIAALYDEARRCLQVDGYTCAVLALRTLLSHVAVERGAEQGLSFQTYVRYLVDARLAPAGSEAWIDSIRERGNEAAHDLEIMDQARAEQVIGFAEMILRFLYDFPARVALSAAGEAP